jgi:hypothetical protein
MRPLIVNLSAIRGGVEPSRKHLTRCCGVGTARRVATLSPPALSTDDFTESIEQCGSAMQKFD